MAKAAKKDKEVSLETVLWNCRVALRGIGSTEKNRDAVISLVFLKFAGTKFEKRYQELKEQYGADEGLFNIMKDKVSSYNSVNVFYLNETSRWSYIVAHAGDNDIAVILDTAMADIERTNPSLKGALSSRDKDGNPVYTFFATLGATTAKLKDLIDNVNKIDEKRFQEEDLIGRVYEYFLQIYAASGTKEDGEFYTPACVVKLIAEMIEPYSGTVYESMSCNIIQLNEQFIHNELKTIVKNSVEETLNALLGAEADKLVQAERYAREQTRKGYRAGHYERSFSTQAGDVTLKVPKLKGLTFESAIIQRYQRRECSVEEALVEMYLAGIYIQGCRQTRKWFRGNL